jgi:hypothetical protein
MHLPLIVFWFRHSKFIEVISNSSRAFDRIDLAYWPKLNDKKQSRYGQVAFGEASKGVKAKGNKEIQNVPTLAALCSTIERLVLDKDPADFFFSDSKTGTKPVKADLNSHYLKNLSD